MTAVRHIKTERFVKIYQPPLLPDYITKFEQF